MGIPKRLKQKLLINNMIEGIDTQKFVHAYLNSYHKVTAIRTESISNVSEAFSIGKAGTNNNASCSKGKNHQGAGKLRLD